jgi:hypothetical protein
VPSADIFNPQQLRKAVARNALQSPFVLYPAVIGGLGVVACSVFGFTILSGGALIGGSVLSLAALIAEISARHDVNALRIIREATKRIEAERSNLVKTLEGELNEFDMPIAADQLRGFKNAFERFQDVLDDRFSATELTYARYLGVAEKVFLGGLDNLRNIVILRKALSNIDSEVLRYRLEGASIDPVERHALQERLNSYESSENEIEKLLVTNERALTTLDRVTQTLAMTQVGAGSSESDTEAAMVELETLSERLAEYV